MSYKRKNAPYLASSGSISRASRWRFGWIGSGAIRGWRCRSIGWRRSGKLGRLSRNLCRTGSGCGINPSTRTVLISIKSIVLCEQGSNITTYDQQALESELESGQALVLEKEAKDSKQFRIG